MHHYPCLRLVLNVHFLCSNTWKVACDHKWEKIDWLECHSLILYLFRHFSDNFKEFSDSVLAEFLQKARRSTCRNVWRTMKSCFFCNILHIFPWIISHTIAIGKNKVILFIATLLIRIPCILENHTENIENKKSRAHSQGLD